MRHTVAIESNLDLSSLSNSVTFNTDRLDVISIQGDSTGTTLWTTAVATVTISNNGDAWYAVQAGAVTLTAPGITAKIDVSAVRFVRVQTTTIQSGTGARLTMYGQGDSQDDRQEYTPVNPGYNSTGVGSVSGGGSSIGGVGES